MTDCDPIIEAGDDAEILDESEDAVPPGTQIDRSADGTITCVARPGEGMTIHVDPTTDFGEKLDWMAGHRGESADELVAEALREYVEDEQAD